MKSHLISLIDLSILMMCTSMMCTGTLLAHGGQPKVLALAFHQGTTPMVIDNLGLFDYDEQADDWRWMCDDAVNAQTGLLTALPFEQTLVATSRVGNYRSIDRGCGFSLIEGVLAEYSIGAYFRHTDPLKPNHIWAYSQSLGRYNDLFLSQDGGLTWAAKGLMAEGIVYGFWQSLSDPQVLYVNHASGFLKSDNGGQSFSNLMVQIEQDVYRNQEIRILGGNASDANHFWVTALRFPNAQLLETKDGGLSWQIIHEVADNYESLAYHVETSTLVVSTPFEGFFRRLADGTWEKQAEELLACLTYQENRLWACGRGLPAKWLLAYSDDMGKTWIPKFEKYRDASRLVWDCDANAPSLMACSSRCLSENCSPSGTKLDMQITDTDMNDQADKGETTEMMDLNLDRSMLDRKEDLGILSGSDQKINESSNTTNSKQGCQSNALFVSWVDLLFYTLLYALLYVLFSFMFRIYPDRQQSSSNE